MWLREKIISTGEKINLPSLTEPLVSRSNYITVSIFPMSSVLIIAYVPVSNKQ